MTQRGTIVCVMVVVLILQILPPRSYYSFVYGRIAHLQEESDQFSCELHSRVKNKWLMSGLCRLVPYWQIGP